MLSQAYSIPGRPRSTNLKHRRLLPVNGLLARGKGAPPFTEAEFEIRYGTLSFAETSLVNEIGRAHV